MCSSTPICFSLRTAYAQASVSGLVKESDTPLSSCAARQFSKMGIGGSMFPQQTPELMIISTIHNKPCKYTPGDHYNFMSIVNKQVGIACSTSFHLMHYAAHSTSAHFCHHGRICVLTTTKKELSCKLAPVGAQSLHVPAASQEALGLLSLLACFAQDYARLHSYKVIATSAVADPSLDNMWNKVGWLLKAYHVRPLFPHPSFDALVMS